MSKRRRPSKLERVLIYRRAKGCCALCGKPIPIRQFHADHIIPFSVTGRTVLSELQATCAECNLNKGVKYAKDVYILPSGSGSGG
jgi:5-methylcytosine-specific restriction endonuclease McrA